jgi:hypothetical protein
MAAGGDGVRAVRLAAFAVAATCLALGSHVLAGGGLPAWAPLLVACLLPGAAGVLLTRRRRGLLDIFVMFGGVQLAMHEVFAAAATSRGRAGSGGGMSGDCPMTSLAPVGQGTAGSGGGGLVMLAAHLAATVATAALLAWGEHVLGALVRALALVHRGSRWMASAAAPRPVAVRLPRPVIAGPPVSGLGLVAMGGVVRRGPPPAL